MRRPLAAVPLAVALALALLVPAMAMTAGVIFPRGSVIGLVPPAGMTESQAFPGFEDRARNASLIIRDLPPDAFGQIEAGMSEQALAAKGVTLLKQEPFPLAGARAMLYEATQSAGLVTVRKWVLLAGNETVTAFLTFQAPDSESEAYPSAVVKAAFATLSIRSVTEQMAALPFALTDLAGFRPVATAGGTVVFLTDGPKNAIEGAEQPVFVVSIGAPSPREGDRRDFAVRLMSGLPGVRELRLERAEPLRISGQTGFEVMATGKDAKTGTPIKVVLWLRFGPTAFLQMVGITRQDDFPDLYDRLRALRDGIESR
ncbi:hypothetical protein EZH22_06490 [Xanthobacter dioxanivorans]|uniref:Uncharacterized protein n=1 Tax=Xanthobacter dioxanivorans TaxID=2528964 RepID=A0A974PQU2_9HYPH|nr:hypothetical protein [Xanthobacter dioxanivorans]QRG07995.1 hypothetical protein EZH22_06490 [Xanthobacter dioxanivorans]